MKQLSRPYCYSQAGAFSGHLILMTGYLRAAGAPAPEIICQDGQRVSGCERKSPFVEG